MPARIFEIAVATLFAIAVSSSVAPANEMRAEPLLANVVPTDAIRIEVTPGEAHLCGERMAQAFDLFNMPDSVGRNPDNWPVSQGMGCEVMAPRYAPQEVTRLAQ